MNRPTTVFLMAGVLACCLAVSTPASDWPHFRGPQRDGKSDESGLLPAWGEGQPKEVWRKPIDAGFSSVAVVGERLFTLAKEAEEDVLLCISAVNGETLWRTVIGESVKLFPEDGPRSTPTVSGETVFAVSSRGRVAAVKAEDGTPIWAKELRDWGPPPRFGYSGSPLVDGDIVILETGEKGKPPGVVALDRKTGELRWSALEGPTGYSTPIVVELAGVRQYVFFRPHPADVVSLSTEGEELWRHTTDGNSVIVSPIFISPDRFFVSTSDDLFGGLMLTVTATDGKFSVEATWGNRLMRNHFNSSVLVDGNLYGFDNSTFRCIDTATGERRWAKRGLGKGSLLAAGDLLYVLADDGTLVLVRATSESYQETGRVQAMEGRAWTSPSLSDGRLYVRDSDELASFDVRGKGAAAGAQVAVAGGATKEARPELSLEGLDLEGVLSRYRKARGGAEAWGKLQVLEMKGSYAAFSEVSDFDLIRKRGDLYRLDFELLGKPAIRARDAEGPWGQHTMFQPEPGRMDGGPYKAQIERESLFEPVLFDPAEKDSQVALLGLDDLNGVTTLVLGVTLSNGQDEVWHLDAHTFLEVAVESQVFDFTQRAEPMLQRAFFDDFRAVDGVVLPYRIDFEFGARLETMTVREVVLNPQIDDARFKGPARSVKPE